MSDRAESAALARYDFLSLFECPVCYDYILPPILQCIHGHLMCVTCRARIDACPICSTPLDHIRNTAMEKVAMKLIFPCKHVLLGCNASLSYSEKQRHDISCQFRPYSCPISMNTCNWYGRFDELLPHLNTHENVQKYDGDDVDFLINDAFATPRSWFMIQKCFGQNFLFLIKKQELYAGYQQFFAMVKMIGTCLEAEDFTYRLKLNGSGRRLQWESKTTSIQEDIVSSIVQSDGLIFDTFGAQFFIFNGKLQINVTIKKIERVSVAS